MTFMRHNIKASSQLQQQSFEPFPLGDFKGASLEREPWLTAKNAFRDVIDCQAFRGQMVKRRGFTRFATLTYSNGGSEFTQLGTGLLVDARLLLQIVDPERPSIEAMRFTYQDATNGTLTMSVQNNAGTWHPANTVNYVLGTIKTPVWEFKILDDATGQECGFLYINSSLPFYAVVDDLGCVCDIDMAKVQGFSEGTPTASKLAGFWYRAAENEVTGLYRYRSAGSIHTLAGCNNQLYHYDPVRSEFTQIGVTGSNPVASFNGTDKDYWWFWPTTTYCVATNGVDPPQKWDPTADLRSTMATDFTGDGNNNLQSALLVVVFENRLIYLNVKEDGTEHPTRARFSRVGQFETFDSQDFEDAESALGDIVSAALIGERLFVAFDDGWQELRFTGDDVKPFAFEPYIGRFGAIAKHAVISDNERLLTRSKTNITAQDSNGQYNFDVKIPELMLEANPAEGKQCFAIRNEPQRAFWWSLARNRDERPNDVVVATYDEQSQEPDWSVSRWTMNVYSLFDSDQTPTWNSLGPRTWNDYSGFTWNGIRNGVAGFQQIIGGGARGTVYVFNVSNRDEYWEEPQAIQMLVSTPELTPINGQKTNLGWLDIYAEVSEAQDLTLRLYADKDIQPYKTVVVSLKPTANNSKVYRRVKLGRTAVFHRFEFETSDTRAVAFDGFIPWFKPAGRVKRFN